jgi:pimeloyl-ACP methyl ester carboxylesterase
LRILTGQPLKIGARFYLPPGADAGEARALDEALGEESALACLELLLPSDVRKARCPVLVVGSRDDALVSPGDLALTARLTGGELRLLDGYGHAPMLGPRAGESFGAIVEWVAQRVGTPATTASRKPGARGLDGSL